MIRGCWQITVYVTQNTIASFYASLDGKRARIKRPVGIWFVAASSRNA